MADAIIREFTLGFPWETQDPFLFCVYHRDDYPAGNPDMGPAASLEGRTLGNDFVVKDGWRMYHGRKVPGFPAHPHRGFETVTIVRSGFIDHCDSLGAAARFGQGDTQWLTAGRGVVHSEIFPLRNRDTGNPLELFQIWLNLPKADKMAEPYFTMLWAGDIPTSVFQDETGNKTEVTFIAGAIDRENNGKPPLPPPPPPNSWAARPESDLAIWTLRMDPHAGWRLPPARSGTNRTLYFFSGKSLHVEGTEVTPGRGLELRADGEINLTNGPETAELLLLQGRPIGEPVEQYGPFVMNTREEIQQAYQDYQRTQFGGWPWPSDAPVHPREAGRFARHADGHEERPE